MDVMFDVNSERQKKCSGSTMLLTLALVCLLVALLSGIGATFCAAVDAQKHADGQEYFDGQLVWTRNDGTTPTTDDGTNRIVPTEGRVVTLAAKNVGTEDMFARVKFNFKWVACEKSADGTTYTKVKDINASDAENVSNGALFSSDKLTLVPASDGTGEIWTDGEDGYYYYDKGENAILPGETTEQLNATVDLSAQVGDTYNNNLHHELSAEENRYVEYAADGSVAKEYYTGVEVDAKLEAVTQPYEATAADEQATGGTQGTIAKTGDEVGALALVVVAFMVLSMLACALCALAGRFQTDGSHVFEKQQVRGAFALSCIERKKSGFCKNTSHAGTFQKHGCHPFEKAQVDGKMQIGK